MVSPQLIHCDNTNCGNIATITNNLKIDAESFSDEQIVNRYQSINIPIHTCSNECMINVINRYRRSQYFIRETQAGLELTIVNEE